MNKATLLSRIRDLSTPMKPIPTEQQPKLQSLPDVNCIAFDFYGTMFISGVGDIGIDEKQSSESRSLFQEALINSGFSIVKKDAARQGLIFFDNTIEQYQKEHRAQNIDYPEPDIVLIWYEVLQNLIGNKYIEGNLDREVAQRFAVEYEFRFNAVWPMPGLMETLTSLERNRFILGIISNSQFYTPLAFEALTNHNTSEAGFDTDLLVWSYRASVKKPSLQFYGRFVKAFQSKHNIPPEQVLYVGNDMFKDIKPALELGMKTALFAGDKRSLKLRTDEPQCKDIEPHIVVTELGQIAECTDRIF